MSQTLAGAVVVVGLFAFFALLRSDRTNRGRRLVFGSKVLEHLGQVEASGGVIGTVTLRVYRLAPQYDDDGIGLEIGHKTALSLSLLGVRLTRAATHELVRLVQQGALDVESPRRAGPEALHELGQVEGRGFHGSVLLRVRRLLLPQEGTNVALGIVQKVFIASEIGTVWLTVEQAANLGGLLERAVAQASATA